MRSVVIAVVTVVLAGAPAEAQSPERRPFSLDDLGRIADVADPQLSPDGQWIAYTVRTPDVDKDKRNTDIWMVRWDGSERIQLTSSPENESRPRWSPDGKYLAFVASRGDEEEKKKGAQVWLLNRAGGEAQKLTDVKGGVDQFEWSPDSTRLALVVDDPDPADDPEKIEAWKRKARPPIVIDRYTFKRDSRGYLEHLYSHVYVFDLQKRTAEPITAGRQDDTNAVWSPDGKQIAFVSKRGADTDRTNDSNVFVVQATAGAEPRQLTTYQGFDGGSLAWSPDGRHIAYLQGDVARYWAYQQRQLAIVPTGGGAARVLTASLDRAVSSPEWSADGQSLFVTVEDDRVEYLARVALDTGAVERLTTGRNVVQSFDAGPDGRVAVLLGRDEAPSEVHALADGTVRQLTDHNAWAKDVAFSQVDDVTFSAKDGTVVNALLARPAGATDGKPLPLILWIHGGPNGQDDHSFDNIREILAASGYAVLQVNYRGSAGRGSTFQKAIYGDWGNLEVVDLLAGVDWAVREGIADPARLGIGGWSYGGILTNYTIATDQRFKAAASGAGSSLQLSMYGTDQYAVQYDNEMGQPWKHPDVWMKVSYPFFKAHRIVTPTLFMCGEKDFNVPITGSEQMYQALVSNRVEAQLVIYPGQFHGITRPSYYRDRLERYVNWYDEHVQGKDDATSTTAGR